MIKAFVLTLFWIFLIPCFLGLGILKFDKKKNKNLLLAMVIGFFVELLFFTILSISMTFMKATFFELRNIWAVIVLIFTLVSIIINVKDYKEIYKQNLEEFKKIPKILTLSFIILLLIQCYFPFKYMHIDFDDSNFVAKASIAIDTNSLFIYDDAGKEYKEFPTRTVLSQFPHFTATIATLADVHPTILAHTIFPVIFIIMMYAFYYVFGLTLFKKDQRKTMMFLNILSFAFIFGSYSRYTNFVRILYRAWQGKSILANITLPFIWYVFIEYFGKENSNFGWFILGICLIGSIALSSMALILPIITLLILMFVFAIKYKRIKYIIIMSIMCILCFICVIAYFKIGNPIAKNSAFNNDELSIEEKIDKFIDGIDDESNIKLVEESYNRAGGPRYYIPIFLFSIVYAWVFCKKEKSDIAAVFSVFSIMICIICINPIISRLWTMIVESGVYWRVYWLLPIGYSISYMFTDLVYRVEKKIDRFFVFGLIVAIFMITGVNVYSTENFKDTDNYFKIPDLILEMIFEVSEDENDYKKLAAPEDFLIYTRQVDGNIITTDVRSIGGSYSKTSLVNLILEGDFESIYNEAIKQKCNYLIVPKSLDKDGDSFIKYGYEFMHENDNYVLYKIEL